MGLVVLWMEKRKRIVGKNHQRESETGDEVDPDTAESDASQSPIPKEASPRYEPWFSIRLDPLLPPADLLAFSYFNLMLFFHIFSLCWNNFDRDNIPHFQPACRRSTLVSHFDGDHGSQGSSRQTAFDLASCCCFFKDCSQNEHLSRIVSLSKGVGSEIHDRSLRSSSRFGSSKMRFR